MRATVSQATSLPYKRVFINSVALGVAHCTDEFGVAVSIPVSVRRAKGVLPAAGETWVVDKSISNSWTFAAVTTAVVPAITGERAANPALENLLAQLQVAGLVKNQTTVGTAGGLTGSADIIEFIQSTPSATWVISHSFKPQPTVTVIDSADTVVEGEVDYDAVPGAVQVKFSGGFSGRAYVMGIVA